LRQRARSTLLIAAMNVHHLELFYYVARHGGISAAVRHIPYGIQQPAVSGQMSALEGDLGTKLFERSPFRLTAAGERLFGHVEPFFKGLTLVAEEVRAASGPELRIGAAEIILRDHVSVVMQRVRTRYPRTRLSLHSHGYEAQSHSWLRDGRIDIAIMPVNSRPPPRLRQIQLVRIPLVLLVHRSSQWRNAAELWAAKKITEPLVGQHATSRVMQGFQRGIKKLGISWPQVVEATSAELITRYVANGEGHGVNVGLPDVVKHRDVRVLPLDGFEPMTMGVLWHGDPPPLVRAVIEEVQRYSHESFPQWIVDDTLPWVKKRKSEIRA
jgi:DNA-binding transcriptional LysR family regulator